MRSVVATLPIAIASAYASGLFLSPRAVTLDFAQVAEITNSSSTVGIADSSLSFMSQADINKTLDQLQAIGVNNIRVLVPWASIETSDNVYSWTQMDMVMNAAAARNMGVMADINSTPLWAAPPNTYPGAGTPPVAQFSSFVQQFATKYGSTVSAYEVWNEPNYALFYQPIDPVSYTALLAAAYPVIKSIDPTATVVAGALGAGQTTGLTMNPVDFVSGMMAAGAGSYFDALSFHPYQQSLKFSAGYTYPGLGTPLEQLDAIKSMIGTAKSVWISEYGLPTNEVSQQQQSDYIKDLLDTWQTYSQAGPVFLYTTRDGTAGGSSLTENSFGLYNNNWTPKTAALTLEAWIKAHPQTPGTPTTPTTPPPTVDPVAAYFAAVAAQYAAFVAAYVAALQQLMSAWATPTAVATPLALKVAAVQAPTSLVATTEEPAAETATAADAKTAVTTAATADAKATATAAAAAADALAGIAEEASVTTPVTPGTPATPVTATPVDVATLATAESTATTPDAGTPVAAKPDAATPVAAKPDASKTGTDKTGTDKSGTDKSASDKTGTDKPASDKTGADKPAAGKADSDKTGADKAAAGKPSAGKTGSDKPGADKTSADKPGAAKSDSDKSGSTPRGKWKVRHGKDNGSAGSNAAAGASASAGAK